MMLSGEENLPANITHFVEDCGYTNAWDEFKGELACQFSLPAFPLLHLTSYPHGWYTPYTRHTKGRSSFGSPREWITPIPIAITPMSTPRG
jgi:hypothetical protein